VGLPEDGRRRRPPAGPALKFVEKLLTTNLTSTDTTERNIGMLRVAPPYGMSGMELLAYSAAVAQKATSPN
jgi:hypothetical protein